MVVFVWLMTMLFMAVRHASQHGLPKLPRRPKQEKLPPDPNRAEQLAEARSEFEEELQLLDTLKLNDFEKSAAILHARQKYTHQIKGILG